MEHTLAAAQQAMQEGDWNGALERFEAALAKVVGDGTAGDAADILRRIGSIHQMRGELEIAEEIFATSLCIAELNGLDRQIAAAQIGLAAVAQCRGDLCQAESLYQQAGSRAEIAGEERIAAMAEQNLGTLANIRGDLEGALRRYEGALARYRRLGDDLHAAGLLTNLGMAHVDREDWGAAERCFDEAFDAADRVRDMELLGSVSLNRAELHLKRRDYQAAREACDFAYEIFTRLESTHGTAEAHRFYGVLYRASGKPALAETHLGLAADLANRCENLLLVAEVEAERAKVFLQFGKNPEALGCLNRAHRIFAGLQARKDVADVDQRLDSLENTFLRVMQAWAESIEEKDEYTAGHCRRVADYACLLAEAVGIGGRELVWFRMGAFLHDIGKIAVPDEVLNKPGKLTDEEWVQMRHHTVAGDEMVAKLDFAWDIRPLVRSHHEHWEGTGYPDGLRGEEIPRHARILCVADVYDALTSARSYRPALTHAEALRIMERDSGRIFDPTLFAVFKQLLADRARTAA